MLACCIGMFPHWEKLEKYCPGDLVSIMNKPETNYTSYLREYWTGWDQSYPWKVQYLWLHWRSFRSQISTRSWWPGARRGRHSTRPQCLRWSNAWEETLTREPESPGSRGSRLQVVRSYCLTDSYICAYEIKDKNKTDNEDVNQSAMWYVNYELCPEKLCSGHVM